MPLELYRPGDIVTATTKQSSPRVRRTPPDGARLEVLSLVYSKIDVGRINRLGREPGIYRVPLGVLAQDATGAQFQLLRHEASLPDAELKLRMDALRDEYGVYQAPPRERIAELPETPLYELDQVIFRSRDQPLNGTVASIDYLQIGEDTRSGHPYPAYTVEVAPGTTMSISAGDVISHTRGPVWKHLHNERITWPNIEAEAKFFAVQMGHSTHLRNPASRNFAWTIDQAVEHLRAGDADLITGASSLFGEPGMICVHRVHDRDLASRIRQHLLESWAEPIDAPQM